LDAKLVKADAVGWTAATVVRGGVGAATVGESVVCGGVVVTSVVLGASTVGVNHVV
jgi:uncharacterized Zn-binding protein involved in type VI secretion